MGGSEPCVGLPVLGVSPAHEHRASAERNGVTSAISIGGTQLDVVSGKGVERAVGDGRLCSLERRW